MDVYQRGDFISLSLKERKAVVREASKRYKKAGKKEKGKILINKAGNETADKAFDGASVGDTQAEQLEQVSNNEFNYPSSGKGQEHLDKTKSNRKNSFYSRNLLTQIGEVSLNIPRDRYGEFHPFFIDRYNKNLFTISERLNLKNDRYKQRDKAETTGRNFVEIKFVEQGVAIRVLFFG